MTPAQIAQLARARGLDPRAVGAVGGQEGYSGRIGDSGHAFGPFQLNDAGGVLTGKFPGWSQQQKQEWAWSQPGVEYALGGIQKVAGGLTGANAVRNIVSRFERPADIPGETARALAGLGTLGAGAAGSALPGPPARQQPAQFNPGQLLQSLGSVQGGDYGGFYQRLGSQLRNQPPGNPVGSRLGNDGQATTLPQRGLVRGATNGEQPQLLRGLAALARFTGQPIQINSGFRSRQRQAQLYANRGSNPNPVAAPGHSLHERGLAADGTIGGKPIGTLPAPLLARFGLQAVPGDPVHVQVAQR